MSGMINPSVGEPPPPPRRRPADPAAAAAQVRAHGMGAAYAARAARLHDATARASWAQFVANRWIALRLDLVKYIILLLLLLLLLLLSLLSSLFPRGRRSTGPAGPGPDPSKVHPCDLF